MTHSKGGAVDGDLEPEGSVELKDFAPGGSDGDGVQQSPLDPSGGAGLPESPSLPVLGGDGVLPDSWGDVLGVQAVPGPGPIFVTILDPGTVSSGTFAVPYGSTITVSHTGTVTVTTGIAFPKA